MKRVWKYGLRVLLLCCLLAMGHHAFATHQRAGEISYVYVRTLTGEFLALW